MMPQPDYIAWCQLGSPQRSSQREQEEEEDSSKNHRCAIMIGSATEVSGIGDWNALLVFAVALQQISWQRNQDAPQEEEENELSQLSLSFTALQ